MGGRERERLSVGEREKRMKTKRKEKRGTKKKVLCFGNASKKVKTAQPFLLRDRPLFCLFANC